MKNQEELGIDIAIKLDVKDMYRNLWEEIKLEYKNIDLLNDFRSINGFNKRLGTWSPISNDSRYYKSLLYEFSNSIDLKISNVFNSQDNYSDTPINKGDGLRYYFDKIKNTDFGNPVTIKYYGMEVDMDYLLSVEEIFFLKDVLANSETILEIGAGFGRLTHATLNCFSSINKYYIVDLDWMLDLSRKYLKKVLSTKDFKKVEFIKIENLKKLNKINLVINIDSFQEMEEEVIMKYLNFISKRSNFFYSKNAFCKYEPSIINLGIKNEKQYNVAMKMGLCTDLIDIFNTSELELGKKKSMEIYQPSGFEVLKNQDCFGQYLYYYSILYNKKIK